MQQETVTTRIELLSRKTHPVTSGTNKATRARNYRVTKHTNSVPMLSFSFFLFLVASFVFPFCLFNKLSLPGWSYNLVGYMPASTTHMMKFEMMTEYIGKK